ncbi:hypothetical protein BH11PLA2_BH11PLA2_12700 [soil metagenome]
MPGDLLFAAASLRDRYAPVTPLTNLSSWQVEPQQLESFRIQDLLPISPPRQELTPPQRVDSTAPLTRSDSWLDPIRVMPTMTLANVFVPLLNTTGGSPASSLPFLPLRTGLADGAPSVSDSVPVSQNPLTPRPARESKSTAPASPITLTNAATTPANPTISLNAPPDTTDLSYITNGQTVGLIIRSDRVAFMLDDVSEANVNAVAKATGLTYLRTLGTVAAVYEGPNAASLAGTSIAGVTVAVPVFTNASSGRDSVALNEIIVALKPGVTPESVFTGDQYTGFHRLIGTTDEYVATVPGTGLVTVAAANALAADARVAWSEPDFYDEIEKYFLPNDPLLPNQWHLNNTGQNGGTVDADADLDLAWNLNPGGTPNRLISIVDDGIELTHPDLNVWTNPGEIAGNSLDDDGNGFIDDVNGWNFVGNNNIANEATSGDRHGTAVSGIAAAKGDNALGVTGASYKAQVMSVRIFNNGAAPNNSGLASAIYYAAGRNGSGVGTFASVSVMNNSWGGGGLNAAIQTAFSWATVHGRGDLGTVAVVASGNKSGAFTFHVSQPANYSLSNTGLIGVGASTNLDQRASYSNFGAGLDLVAPSNGPGYGGTLNITTTDRIGSEGYDSSSDYTSSFGGTSAATPLVAGIAALVLSQADAKGVTLTAADVRSLLKNGTDLLSPLTIDGGSTYRTSNGSSVEYGAGRINAFTSVDGVGKPEISVVSSTTEFASGGTVALGNSLVGYSTTQTLRIRNQGTSVLTLGAFSMSGNSAFSVENVSATSLKLGESATFTVRFSPTALGAANGTVSINSNDANEGTFTLSLTGTSTAANITGNVFEDRNGNGVKEADEPGLSGRSVFLDTNGNGVSDRFSQTISPNIAIPDNNTTGITSSISVGGLTGTVSNITVKFNITHTADEDLVIKLNSSNGGTITLVAIAGADGDNYTNTVLDDTATTLIGSGTAPFTGTYRPMTPLSTYNGLNPNGNWTLNVADYGTGDVGTLLNWTIAFDTEAQVVTDPQGQFGFGGLPAGTYTVTPLLLAGWAATNSAKSVTLATTSDSVSGVTFGNAKNNRVYGQIWDDKNANGIKDPGELPVSGRTVFADTNANGNYDSFTPVTFSKTANLSIPDNTVSGVTSALAVSGQTGTITDVDVTVNVRHNFIGDVKLTLISPTNQTVVLTNLRGGFGTNMVGTIFDDQATSAIATVNDNDAPFTGRYKPESLLATLNGASANGTWQLVAADLGPGDTGTLESWSITVTSGVTEASCVTDSFGDYSLDVGTSSTTVRVLPLAGFKFTSPISGALNVTGAGAPLYDRHFGVAEAVNPVVVTPITQNNGEAQRSRITTFDIVFSERVEFTGTAANAFAVTGPDGSVPFTASVDDTNPYTRVTLTFTGGPLPTDGHYAVAVIDSLIKDVAQNPLTPTSPLTFHRLLADFNGDGTVNGADLVIFGNAFAGSTGDPNFVIEADFNNDGTVNGADLVILGNQFGKTV